MILSSVNKQIASTTKVIHTCTTTKINKLVSFHFFVISYQGIQALKQHQQLVMKTNKSYKRLISIITWWKSKASKRFMSARNRSTPNPSIHTGRPVLAIHLLNTKKKNSRKRWIYSSSFAFGGLGFCVVDGEREYNVLITTI